jgi:hypothetical protein
MTINNHRGTSGFHEARLDGEAIRRRLQYIEKMLEEAEKVVSAKR